MIGKTLDRYEIVREIGRGAMGQVYLARDTRLNRHVALKLLPPAVVADRIRRRRFARESLALAALNHPNIVTIHSVDEVDGQPFLVMEWVQGRSLAEQIPPAGLRADRWFELALPLTAAVAEAHRAGIVHRDLKPSNVMVRTDGVVKVVDFGISLIETETLVDGAAARPGEDSERLTAEGVAIGTLPYMSPEQLMGRFADARSDVFSLGVILFEMATGHPPFFGASQAALAAAILRDTPGPPTRLNSALPAALDQVIERTLAKRPEGRYETAGDLHRELAAIHRQAETPPGAPMATAPAPLPSARPALSASTAMSSSVAVLPLRNLSGDPAQEYLSEGTTEMMIANLAKVGGMRVIARSSVMAFKAERPGLPEISRQLGVQYLVDGSVQRSGDELMIIVELVDPGSGGALWGDTYRGGLREVFAFQQQVAQEVARAIKGELSTTDHSRLGPFREVAPEVFEAYLKARYLLNKRTPDAVREALRLLDDALASDPGYALGWAARAECYVYFVSNFTSLLPGREGLPMAREAALRALQLDPSLSEAHVALGVVHLQSWEWDQVESEFLRAIELNPSNADAYQKYTLYLTAQGRHEEALAAIHRARKLDPLSLPLRFGLASNCIFAGRYEEAAESAQAVIALQPENWIGHLQLGIARSLQARYDEAEAELSRAAELSRRAPLVLSSLGRNAALAGRTEEARRIVAELEAAASSAFVPPTLVALPLVALGEDERALDWLEKAVEVRDQEVLLLRATAFYRRLNDHPRFARILARIGLA